MKVIISFLFYGWNHRPFEALTARLLLHPLASASCSVGIVTIVIAAIPNKATAAAMAITTNAVLFILSCGKEDRV